MPIEFDAISWLLVCYCISCDTPFPSQVFPVFLLVKSHKPRPGAGWLTSDVTYRRCWDVHWDSIWKKVNEPSKHTSFSQDFCCKIRLVYWLVVSTPLENMNVNWDNDIFNMENNPVMFQSPPTSMKYSYHPYQYHYSLSFSLSLLSDNDDKE